MTWDYKAFHWINDSASNAVFDAVMPPIAHLETFIPVLLILVLWMLFRDGARGRVTVAALIVLIAASDQISSHVIKPAVNRSRPCHQESGLTVILRDNCGPGRSFPSSHAANMGAAAAWLILRYRRWAWLMAIMAGLVGYSRIYTGLHYPADVVCGWALGTLLALALYPVVRRLDAWRGRGGH